VTAWYPAGYPAGGPSGLDMSTFFHHFARAVADRFSAPGVGGRAGSPPELD
jgi:hypothetical protein